LALAFRLNSQPRGQVCRHLDSRELAQQKRFQQLSEQAANLEEILRTSRAPTILAAVRRPETPFFAKPMEPGDVLFKADAEDEFKYSDESGGWVHVQVSGNFARMDSAGRVGNAR